MPLKIYNTLSQSKEDFQPLNSDEVKMYVCGVTPYDEAHLGHGRAYVTFDLVRRYLEFSGFKVNYVQNVTDIDDKLIKKSQESGKTVKEIAEKYTQSYLGVMKDLNVLEPSKFVKATEHINDMTKWIKTLEEKGFAYAVDGDVYFEVAKFKDYAKLSKRKVDDMLSGARVAVDERKKSPLDFALWKAAKEGEPSWDSPWGKGRPGWHIECSVMSTKYLGEQFDIHGGGRDLIFPHHENEIAQTEACTGKPWVKYWLHNGFVNINKQKMSKSLGNFFTLRDIFKQFDPMVVRFFFLQTHYRSPINYSDQDLASAKEAYGRICKFVEDLDFLLGKTKDQAPKVEELDIAEELQPYKDQFKAAMDDDFNTAGAIAAIFGLIHFCNQTLAEGESEKQCLEIMKQRVLELCSILGLKIRQLNKISPEADKLRKERDEARKAKDYSKADEIRLKLEKMNYIVKDTKEGTQLSGPI